MMMVLPLVAGARPIPQPTLFDAVFSQVNGAVDHYIPVPIPPAAWNASKKAVVPLEAATLRVTV